jgi:hypothetical protein
MFVQESAFAKIRVEFDTHDDLIKFLEWKFNSCIYPTHTFSGIKTDESFYLNQDVIKVREYLEGGVDNEFTKSKGKVSAK